MSEIDQAYTEFLARLGERREDGMSQAQANIVCRWQAKIESQGDVNYQALKYALNCARKSEFTMFDAELDEIYNRLKIKTHDHIPNRLYNTSA